MRPVAAFKFEARNSKSETNSKYQCSNVQNIDPAAHGFSHLDFDAFLKSQESTFPVIPAEAGIQEKQALLDPGDPVTAKAGSRGDDFDGFLQDHQF